MSFPGIIVKMLINMCLFTVLALSHTVASEKAVVCYYGSWATYRSGQEKFDVTDINPYLCTHLIYAFAGLDTEGNVFMDPYLDLPGNNGEDHNRKFNDLKYRNKNLKTLLAVGGWNQGYAKFSIIAADPLLRQNFIDSAINMITKYGFDGLDIHWEYPNQSDTVHGEVDVENLAILLKELKAAFDKKGIMLTAAVSASEFYDVQGISKYLDLLHIMAYDINAAWDPITGQNAQKDEGDANKIEEDKNIDLNVISRKTESPTVTPNNICKKEGYKVMPGDSSRFIYCIIDGAGLTAKEFKCPANLIWDETVLGCNYPSMVVYGF